MMKKAAVCVCFREIINKTFFLVAKGETIFILLYFIYYMFHLVTTHPRAFTVFGGLHSSDKIKNAKTAGSKGDGLRSRQRDISTIIVSLLLVILFTSHAQPSARCVSTCNASRLPEGLNPTASP